MNYTLFDGVRPGGTHRKRGLERAGLSLKQNHPDLVVSKYRLRQAESIALIRKNREEGTQNLCFSSRPFVLCGLPVRPLPEGEFLYERRNGPFILQITGHPDYGVPYGQDRIVPIFLATLAVRAQSPIIKFGSAAEMLDTFGMQKGGKEYRRLVGAFQRIFGSTIFFGTMSDGPKASVFNMSRFSFLRQARMWFNKDPDALPDQDGENVIVLSDQFYREVIAHPVPTDLEAVRMLNSAPAALDLFMFLSYRCFVTKGLESIPIFGPAGLANQIGCGGYARPRKFREKLDAWLELIRLAWPECPANISSDGQRLLIAPANAIARPQ